MQCILNALLDLKNVFFLSSPFAPAVPTDAVNMANATGIPAIIWTIVWIVIAFGILLLALRVYVAARDRAFDTQPDLPFETKAEAWVSWSVSLKVLLLSMSDVVHIDPEIMGGTPVFKGTRVPIETLFDYIEGGEPLNEFLEDFPTVTQDQVIKFLEELKREILPSALVVWESYLMNVSQRDWDAYLHSMKSWQQRKQAGLELLMENYFVERQQISMSLLQ